MPEQNFPAIDLDDVLSLVGPSSYARGESYARQGRVVRCLWEPGAGVLLGSVRGSGANEYITTVYLLHAGDQWQVKYGECSCPMEVNCKHVAAVVRTAVDATRRTAQAQRAPSWQESLDAVLPEPPSLSSEMPLAVELTLPESPMNRFAPGPPALYARLVRPGKRGGWVAGNLNWGRLETLPYAAESYRLSHVRVLQQLFALYQSGLAASGVYRYGHSDAKTIALSDFASPQLWPLLDEAAEVGVRLIHGHGLGDVPHYADASLCLDVTAGEHEAMQVTPVLRCGDEVAKPATFIGRQGHGVVWAEPGPPLARRIRLARLDKPAAPAMQGMMLAGEQLTIPAAEAGNFAEQYWPRLRHVAEVVSSDASFEPPPISEPTLVLQADYRPQHVVELAWRWEYRVGEQVLPSGLTEPSAGHRDAEAEQRLVDGIEAPLDRFRLRGVHGALVDGVRLSGLQTMRFATELQPLLDGAEGVRVEVSGTPADYREAGDSLVIGVSAEETGGDGSTDWFDLGVTISVEGKQVPFVSVFSALATGESHLLLPDGAYFALDKPELARLRELIAEARTLADPETGKLRVSRFQASLFDELAALGVVERQAESWRRQVDGVRALEALPQVEPPSGLHATLRPYQEEGFTWLAQLHDQGLGGILADDMGLGKTLQTLALICHAKAADTPPYLVVAPSSVVANWTTEAERFTPGLEVAAVTDTLRRSGTDLGELTARADVVVTTYTLFRLDFAAYSAQEWSGLILDEAQYVKNHRGKTYLCARKLGAPIKVAITGTPMENNLMELWSLLSITAPGLFPDPEAFTEYYVKPVSKGNGERLQTLRRRMKPLVKRRTKELVAADLPAKQEQVLDVVLHPKHRKAYDQRLQRERQKILGLLDDVDRNRFTILQSLTVLRQLALHAGLVDEEHAEVPSAKIDTLLEHLHDVAGTGHRALVFSQFTRFLGHVRDRLDAAGIEYCYLDGRTRKRPEVIQRFKDGSAPVFLISLKAGGFGLNLTEADYCYLLDPWWNPATETQAVDRTHRIGQTRNVMVYRLISAGTIEEKVRRLAVGKAELFASVIDDGDTFGGALSADDIRALLG